MSSIGIVKKKYKCLICLYSLKKSKSFQTLPLCPCQFCQECLIIYLLEEVKQQKNSELINCPQYSCVQKYQISDYISIMKLTNKILIYNALAKRYCQTSSDVRNCPNSKCQNFGFICGKICNKPIKCRDCNEEWKEYSLYSFFFRFYFIIKNAIFQRNEILSIFYKEFLTNKCANCIAIIEKNYGCNHMTCSLCEYQFCWVCMKKWKKHSEFFCTITTLGRVIIYLFILFLFLYRMQILWVLKEFKNIIIPFTIRRFIFCSVTFNFENLMFLKKQSTKIVFLIKMIIYAFWIFFHFFCWAKFFIEVCTLHGLITQIIIVVCELLEILMIINNSIFIDKWIYSVI